MPIFEKALFVHACKVEVPPHFKHKSGGVRAGPTQLYEDTCTLSAFITVSIRNKETNAQPF